jgi:hypothetical protein
MMMSTSIFLTENACTFSNLNLAVTYIVFDTKEEVILSYFTLSASTIEVTNSEKNKISSDIPDSGAITMYIDVEKIV